MKKQIITVVTWLIVILTFILFWNSTFSIRTSTDIVFLIVYVLAFVICILIYDFNDEKLIYIRMSIIICIETFLMICLYKSWNRYGFFIDVNEVERIEYCNAEMVAYNVEYSTESFDKIISKFNSAMCVKRGDNQSEPGTQSEWIAIYLEDDEVISVDGTGCIRVYGQMYHTSLNIEMLME